MCLHLPSRHSCVIRGAARIAHFARTAANLDVRRRGHVNVARTNGKHSLDGKPTKSLVGPTVSMMVPSTELCSASPPPECKRLVDAAMI